ncbi:outer membrane beta-barrel protein [Alteromonas aestuariivivens]|uniref:outer membrane beta-barrel protein n=1 Tax=Alteromonas aestuariivivens TaxID=1938339 RepID=UPI0015F29279|nr:outer membrane beta-barrel protein [Alteromonas aestuariivivens]
MDKPRIILASLLFVFACSVQANDLSRIEHRAGSWEAGFSLSYVDSFSIDGRNSSHIEIEDDVGFGGTFGYHVNDHLLVSVDFTHNEQSYQAQVIPDDNTQEPYFIQHALSNDSFAVSTTYHFYPTVFTPFVTAGIGWNTLDSNIRRDDYGGTVCWWDPWWGYVCDDYYSTYSDTAFSYGFGAGLRWNIAHNFVLKASLNQRWLDVDSVGDTPGVMSGKLEFVWTAW